MKNVKMKLRASGIMEMSVRSILKELTALNTYSLWLDYMEENHKSDISEDEFYHARAEAFKLKESLKKILTPLIRIQQ